MADETTGIDLDPPHEHADGRALTDEERRNVAAMERFAELYNGEDMERFVRESYALAFHVLNLDGCAWTAGGANRQNLLVDADAFVRTEEIIRAKAPGRRMAFRRVVPSGNVVTLEASIVDESRPGWELSWCGVYTFDGEGRIVSDHTYLNRMDWPGLGELLARPRA
jgi:hypothetical protein